MENGVNLDKEIYDAVKVKKTRRFIMIVIISIVVTVCALIAFFYINYSYRKMNTVTLENYKVYQYFSSIKYEYDGILTIEDGKAINIGDDGNKVDVGDTPIYFQMVDNEMFLTKDMLLVIPSVKNYNYRLNRLSKIVTDKINDQENVYVIIDNKEVYMDTSFLYDGNDLYIFPYSVDLKVDDEVIKLSPLSFVYATYGDSIEIYDKQSDTYKIIDSPKNDVTATLNTEVINLSTDMVIYGDNNDRLLIKSVSKLPLYTGK